MSYFKSYDAYGEPRSILTPYAEPKLTINNLIHESREDKWEREALTINDARDYYETLRHEGKSHDEATEAVKEKYGV